MPKRNAGLRLRNELADAVVVAAVALVTARPSGARWTRENCIAHFNARVQLDAAVVAYLGARDP